MTSATVMTGQMAREDSGTADGLFERIRSAGITAPYRERCGRVLAEIERAHGSLPPLERSMIALVVALKPNRLDLASDVASVLPIASAGAMDQVDLENGMAALGFTAESEETGQLSQIAIDRLPCLYLLKGGDAWVVEDRIGDGYRIFDGTSGLVKDISTAEAKSKKGTSITFVPIEAQVEDNLFTPDRWLRNLLSRLAPGLRRYFAFIFMINVFALAVPLYTMEVYDRAIPSRSIDTLLYLTGGILLLLLLEFSVRRMRAHHQMLLGTRFGYLLGTEVLNRLLTMNLIVGEAATVGSKIPRIKDVDRIRGFLFGPTGQSLMDAPFIVLFLIAMWYVGGLIVVVPIIAIVAFVVFGMGFGLWIKHRSNQIASTSSSLQGLLLEGITKIRAVKTTGADHRWSERVDLAFAGSAAAAYRSNVLQSLVQTLGAILGYATGLGVMTVGVYLVLSDALTAGGLIASMLLVWRVISPMQGVYLALTRFWQMQSSVRQITSLFRVKPEFASLRDDPLPPIQGRIEFNNVSFRFPGASEPVASGLSFMVRPGESLAIIGANGSGKSCVLKLAAGLYRPQVGSVLIDGQDIQQFNPRRLRHNIAFAPQTPEFFEGTILENLRYANPLASRDDMMAALEAAGAWEAVDRLPDGLETRVVANGSNLLSYSILVRLNLARALVKCTPIILLDEPTIGVDLGGDFRFIETLERLKGRATVMAVTHRPGHIRIVDKVLYIAQGRIRYFGAIKDNEEKLLADLRRSGAS